MRLWYLLLSIFLSLPGMSTRTLSQSLIGQLRSFLNSHWLRQSVSSFWTLTIISLTIASPFQIESKYLHRSSHYKLTFLLILHLAQAFPFSFPYSHPYCLLYNAIPKTWLNKEGVLLLLFVVNTGGQSWNAWQTKWDK